MLIWITLRVTFGVMESLWKTLLHSCPDFDRPWGKNISKHAQRFSLSAGGRRFLGINSYREESVCLGVSPQFIFPFSHWQPKPFTFAKIYRWIVSHCLYFIILPESTSLVVHLSNPSVKPAPPQIWSGFTKQLLRDNILAEISILCKKIVYCISILVKTTETIKTIEQSATGATLS